MANIVGINSATTITHNLGYAPSPDNIDLILFRPNQQTSGGGSLALVIGNITNTTFDVLTGSTGSDELTLYWTITSPSNGDSNPNIVAVTSATDFVGTNTTFEIQGDFTLTGPLNLPDGAHVVGAGGVMTANGNTISGTNLSFDSDTFDTFIDLGQNGTLNPTNTYKSGYGVQYEWFGIVCDGNPTTNTGTDNRNVLLQVTQIVNQNGGTAHLYEDGECYYNMVQSAATAGTTPTNWYFTGKSSLRLGPNTVVGGNVDALTRNSVLKIWENEGGTFEGGLIRGDWRNHVSTGGGRHRGPTRNNYRPRQ